MNFEFVSIFIFFVIFVFCYEGLLMYLMTSDHVLYFIIAIYIQKLIFFTAICFLLNNLFRIYVATISLIKYYFTKKLIYY